MVNVTIVSNSQSNSSAHACTYETAHKQARSSTASYNEQWSRAGETKIRFVIDFVSVRSGRHE